MTLLSDLVARTRRHLYTETRDSLNRLAAAIDASVTTLTVDFELGSMQSGALLAIDAEEMHEWTASGTTDVQVERGVNGSTAAAHADGALIYVNPKFSGFSIIQAINDELTGLSAPGMLYRVRTLDLTYQAGTDTYDLAGVTDLIDVLSVSYDANDGTDRWPSIPSSQWRLSRDLDTAVFSSGMALTINGWAESGRPIRVAYKAPFTATLAAMSDNVLTVTGLPVTAHDILPLGAAIRLTAGSEVARNFLDQGETRRAGEVQAGARSNSMQMLRALRAQRISEEAARLYAQHPTVVG